MAASVLCVIDLSDSSRKALQWAIANARTNRAHLTILYPYRLIRGENGETVREMRRKIEEKAQENFGILERDFLRGGKVSYDFRTEVGFLADRVEEHTKNNHINFLVINKNLRSANKESFDDLVENSQVPLVIIP
jgi:nucleotide-binding universal stress UspA family protein